MSERTDQKRRSVLKQSGLAVASVVGIGVSQPVAARSSDKPNTEFDPEKQQEVNTFVRRLNEVDDPSPYLNSLSRRQKKAVASVVTDITLETTIEQHLPATEGRLTTQASTWQSETIRIKQKGKTPAGTTEFIFYQELSWDYNTTDYKNVNQEADYDLPGVAASWEGVTHESVQEQEEHFIAELHGEFALDLFGFKPSKGEAEITTQGDEDGDHEIINKEAHV